jgi:apolipoprotein N-acyltransferase
MNDFQIILKNKKIKSYRLLGFFILLLNTALLLYFLWSPLKRSAAFLSLIILAIYFLLQWNYIRKGKQAFFFNEFIFFILGICWINLENYYAVAINFVIGVLFYLAVQKLSVFVSGKGVTINFFPKKEYSWSQFSNVVLKDGLLTLDFKNNKLFQGEIEEEKGINEREFNSFAITELKSTK